MPSWPPTAQRTATTSCAPRSSGSASTPSPTASTRIARWDRDLGLGEQERLGYARLLLTRPKWLICDEGLDPLDEANRQTLLSILAGELAESAVINISQRREPTDFYGKVVGIVASPPRAAPPKPGGQAGARPPK